MLGYQTLLFYRHSRICCAPPPPKSHHEFLQLSTPLHRAHTFEIHISFPPLYFSSIFRFSVIDSLYPWLCSTGWTAFCNRFLLSDYAKINSLTNGSIRFSNIELSTVGPDERITLDLPAIPLFHYPKSGSRKIRYFTAPCAALIANEPSCAKSDRAAICKSFRITEKQNGFQEFFHDRIFKKNYYKNRSFAT